MTRIRQWLQPYLTLRTLGMVLVGAAAWLAGVPVAFGMADEVSTTVLSNDEATEYISEQTLRVALQSMALYQFAEKHTIPKGRGRTFQIPRYEHLTLPRQPAAQGITPANTPMVVNKVTATSEQWIAVLTIYDVPQLSVAHNILQKATELAGAQAGKTYERETQRVLMAGTNTQFAAGRANRTALTTPDVMNSREVRRACANLKKNGAAPFKRTNGNTTRGYIERMLSGGGGITAAKPGLNVGAYMGLIGVVDQDVSQDMQEDSTFANANAYSNVRALFEGEIGKWVGVVFIESNYFPKIILLASPVTAGANVTGFAASLVAATTYDFVVTRCADSYGIEEEVTTTISQSTGGGNNAVSIALPASTGKHYRVYAGASGGTKYEIQTASSTLLVTADDLTGPTFSPNQTIYVTAIPTSGRVAPLAPATGVSVHVNLFFGVEAYGVAELSALQSFITEDKSTDSDPAKQRRKISWKGMFKAVIQNNNFVRVVEATSNFAG